MSKKSEIVAKIKIPIANIEEYLQLEERMEFEIMDYKGQSYIINEVLSDSECSLKDELNIISDYNNQKVFYVKNAKGVYFIPIDGKKGLFGYGDSFCDCVFFDENNFCFLEFKFNAESLKLSMIRKNRKKAVKQLGNTIEEFDELLDYDYSDLKLEAYMCTPIVYPRESEGFQDFKVQFFDDYEVELFERTEKICL